MIGTTFNRFDNKREMKYNKTEFSVRKIGICNYNFLSCFACFLGFFFRLSSTKT